MKFVAYVGSKEVVTETERPIACCLVGQRNESAERPEGFEKYSGVIFMGKKPDDYVAPTKEQQADFERFERDRRGGKYTTKVLQWFESEEAAEADKVNWPDRINFRVIPVSAKFD